MNFKSKVILLLTSILIFGCSDISLTTSQSNTSSISIGSEGVSENSSNGYFIVSFESNGGTLVPQQTLLENSLISIPIVSKEGHTLDGWFTSINNGITLSDKWNFFTDKVFTNLTLYAKWNINQYTIEFEPNNGETIPSITQDFGTQLTLVSPNQTGFSFVGWYKNQDLTEHFDSSTMPANNFKLYGKWERNSYILSFVTNGGSILESRTLLFESVIENLDTPTKIGNTFQGWFRNSNLTNKVNLPFTMPAENTTFYAKWEVNSYQITFNTNGGNAVDPLSVKYGSSIVLPEVSKIGYSFVNWFSDSSLETLFILTTMPSNDLVLYAKWAINNYKIIFISNGGSPLEEISMPYLSLLVQPSNPTKEGHTFVNWFSDNNFNNLFVFPEFMPAENITLYAKWSVNTYTVTLFTNGGESIEPILFNFGQALSIPKPIKSGYLFIDWFLDENLATPLNLASMPSYDFSLYAKWEKIVLSNISLGFQFSTIILSDGSVYTFGENEFNQIGDQTTNDNLIPFNMSNSLYLNESAKITKIEAGYYHTGVLTNDGSLLMWGYNSKGQIGDGTIINKLNPIDISYYFGLEYDEKIIDIAFGGDHSMALSSSGKLFSWGGNSSGQLGKNDIVDSKTPYQITSFFELKEGEKIIKIDAESDNSSAITSDNRLFIWGENYFGQIGNGSTTDQKKPLDITGRFSLESDENIALFSQGYSHSATLTSKGRLFTWGYNLNGQLGNQSTASQNIPIEITSFYNLNTNEKITKIEIGFHRSAFLTSQNRLFVWGNNSQGQLGTGNTNQLTVPVDITSLVPLIEGETVLSIELGGTHTGIITSQGRLIMMGRNSSGQLGDGTTTNSLVPKETTFFN
jgi:uncharacterized repeat protein (TIGR02543 family)